MDFTKENINKTKHLYSAKNIDKDEWFNMLFDHTIETYRKFIEEGDPHSQEVVDAIVKMQGIKEFRENILLPIALRRDAEISKKAKIEREKKADNTGFAFKSGQYKSFLK